MTNEDLPSEKCMYCMPNNLKAVLRIVPPCVPSRLHRFVDLCLKMPEDA